MHLIGIIRTSLLSVLNSGKQYFMVHTKIFYRSVYNLAMIVMIVFGDSSLSGGQDLSVRCTPCFVGMVPTGHNKERPRCQLIPPGRSLLCPTWEPYPGFEGIAPEWPPPYSLPQCLRFWIKYSIVNTSADHTRAC